MILAAGDPVVDVGAEVEDVARRPIRNLEFDREERRVVHRDAALLDRRDQKIPVAFTLEYGSKQLDQRGPADWRLHVEPGAVGRDPHVEIAAKRRIPQVYRRRTPGAFAPGRL